MKKLLFAEPGQPSPAPRDPALNQYEQVLMEKSLRHSGKKALGESSMPQCLNASMPYFLVAFFLPATVLRLPFLVRLLVRVR